MKKIFLQFLFGLCNQLFHLTSFQVYEPYETFMLSAERRKCFKSEWSEKSKTKEDPMANSFQIKTVIIPKMFSLSQLQREAHKIKRWNYRKFPRFICTQFTLCCEFGAQLPSPPTQPPLIKHFSFLTLNGKFITCKLNPFS